MCFGEQAVQGEEDRSSYLALPFAFVYVPLHLCVNAPLHMCVHVPLHMCVHVPLHLCAVVPLHICVYVPLHLCVIAPLHLCVCVFVQIFALLSRLCRAKKTGLQSCTRCFLCPRWLRA